VKPRKREKKVIGTATMSSMSIKAAKDITLKAIVCVSIFNGDTSCEEIKQFITSMDVRVLFCFVAKTRFVATKAFRICIHRDDKQRFLETDNWPKHVVVRNWFFNAPSKSSEVLQPPQFVLRAHVNLETTQAKFPSHSEALLVAGEPSGSFRMDDDGFLFRADPSSVDVGS